MLRSLSPIGSLSINKDARGQWLGEKKAGLLGSRRLGERRGKEEENRDICGREIEQIRDAGESLQSVSGKGMQPTEGQPESVLCSKTSGLHRR